MTNWIDGCTCDCYEPRGCECPDIIWAGQINISTETEWQVEIFAPENTTITSDDGSVDITETENSPWSINYDLSVECEDNKVWWCATDPNPSSLDEKLFVTSPLIKTVQDCATNGKVVLWINTSLLQDEKVKVASWCSSVYLEDAIEWEGWVDVYRDWCTMKVRVDQNDFAAPFAKMYLDADVEISKSHWQQHLTENEWWFFLPTSKFVDNNPWRSDWIMTEIITAPTFWDIGRLKVMKDWYYRISFNFNADINYGLNAMRWCVFSGMTWKQILLDDKIWTPSWYAINHLATWDAKTNISHAAQVSFSRSDVTYLEAWTIIVLGWRISPYVTNWAWSWMDARVRIPRAWLASGVLWLWPATQNSESWCVCSVEWVSNPDWTITYE